jgi:hypothetical protein
MDSPSPETSFVERRATRRQYEPLLPEFFPVKLVGPFISVDFAIGSTFERAVSSLSRRYPAREALLDTGVAIDTRVTPRKVLAWLRSMPSYQAGMQLRLGHDTDAGLAFDKSAELVELVHPGRSVVYLTRRPLSAPERSFFARPRPNLLLMPTATPRSAALGVLADPLELVRSAEGLDPRRIHWVVGPLVSDSLRDAERIVDALPPGSHLTLRALDRLGLAHLEAAAISEEALRQLDHRALARRVAVTDWSCRFGLAAVGRGFFDVDRITSQADLGRRALDLATCAACPSRTQCHGTLDLSAFQRRLARELETLGLTLAAPPVRTGRRSFSVAVLEPTSRGDEAYLSHALGQPISVSLSAGSPGGGEPSGSRHVDGAVLRRWWGHGFLPVNELNAAAQNALEDLRRRLGERVPAPLRGRTTPFAA